MGIIKFDMEQRNTKMNSEDEKHPTGNVKVINLGSPAPALNFMDGLGLLFIGLKLTDHLETWTWVAVLSPLWAPFMVSWFLKLVLATLKDFWFPEGGEK
jgi:hypothetical protein